MGAALTEEKDDDLWRLADQLATGDIHCCDNLMRGLRCVRPELVWNPADDSLGDDYLNRVYRWWHKQTTPDGRPPSPKAIDPLALKDLLGNLLVIDVIDNGQDFLVRLYGSKVTEHSRNDTTGQKISEVWTPLRSYFLVNYRAVHLRQAPLLSRHTPPMDVNINGWKRLILPFQENDVVTRLLVGIRIADRQQGD